MVYNVQSMTHAYMTHLFQYYSKNASGVICNSEQQQKESYKLALARTAL